MTNMNKYKVMLTHNPKQDFNNHTHT